MTPEQAARFFDRAHRAYSPEAPGPWGVTRGCNLLGCREHDEAILVTGTANEPPVTPREIADHLRAVRSRQQRLAVGPLPMDLVAASWADLFFSPPRESPRSRPPRAAWEATRAAVLVLHGARCAGCGRDLLALTARLRFLRATAPDEAGALLAAEGLPKNRRDAFEVDHRVEVSDGGANEPENLVPLCHSCHKTKTNAYMRAIRNRRR